MRTQEEIQKSVLNAKSGKLADTVQAALNDAAGYRNESLPFTIVVAAIGNIDERLQALEKESKARLGRLEKETFGMTHDEARHVVDSYVETIKENPSVKASSHVLLAEKILGV